MTSQEWWREFEGKTQKAPKVYGHILPHLQKSFQGPKLWGSQSQTSYAIWGFQFFSYPAGPGTLAMTKTSQPSKTEEERFTGTEKGMLLY